MNIDTYRKIRFQGYSMYPFLIPGDILLVKEYALEELKPGNIIVYHDSINKKNVAHRVIRTGPLMVKGDNLTFYDDIELVETDVLSKVNSVERRDRIFTIDPLFSALIAFLSRYNCTPGIIKSQVFGRPIKWIIAKFR